MKPEVQIRASVLFAALANPTRLRIVQALAERPRSVGEVSSEMEILQSSASQHLAILARAGVVVAEQQGSFRIYRVRGPRIGKILELIEEFCTVHGLYGDEPEAFTADELR